MPFQATNLTLYYSPSCGFCTRVLHVMQALDVSMELRNISENPGYRRELVEGGGRGMVPCLHILEQDGGERWMYESADISEYLTQRYGKNTPNAMD